MQPVATKSAYPCIDLINPAADPRWEAFVAAHPYGSIYHCTGWQAALTSCLKHIKSCCLALTEADDSAIVAALPLFEVRRPFGRTALVSVPYATTCDPLVSDQEQMRVLLEKALALAAARHACRLEVRTLHTGPLLDESLFAKTNHYVQHYIPLHGNADDLFQSLNRTNVRKTIRKAIKCNVSVRSATDSGSRERFLELHQATRKRLGLPLQPAGVFEEFWRQLHPTGAAELLIAEHNQTFVGGLFYLRYGSRVSAEILAYDYSSRQLGANVLLYWKAIEESLLRGFEEFDFGRTSVSNMDLMNFKSHWGANLREMPIYYYPTRRWSQHTCANNPWAYRAMRRLLRRSPWGIYRFVSRVLHPFIG